MRYEFDESVAAGPAALIGWLVLFALIVVAVAAALLVLLRIAPQGSGPPSFGEAGWAALMGLLNGGTPGGESGWVFRIVMLTVMLAGVFVFSALIAVLSVWLAARLAALRRGRSSVIERDHIVIFNWSASIFDVIADLTRAHRGRRRPRIVVLADKDRIAMEEEIAARLPGRRNARIVCRSGDPADPDALGIASPQTSRAIVVLSPEGRADADSRVVNTILALVHDPRRRPDKYRIAAEIRDRANADLARLAGGDEAQPLVPDELVARLLVHSSRQPGLGAVYSRLLGAEGCEVRAVEQPAIAGTSFGDALMAYDTCTLIGLTDAAGRVYLNPPMETQIRPGMKAVLVAENAAAIEAPANPRNVDHTAIALHRRQERKPDRTLMLGWNRRGPAIVFELSRHVAFGSLLTIAADTPELHQQAGALTIAGNNLQVEYGIVDTASRTALDGLNVPSYDHVLVLGYIDHLDPRTADMRTLMTLLNLRRIADAAHRRIGVVAEMVAGRSRDLAELTGAVDFVVSSRLVSLMLARASVNADIAAVFADLLDEQGSEFHMRPAELYLELEQPMSFYTVTEACRQHGEVAVGYVKAAGAGSVDAHRDGAVVVNPKKSEIVTFTLGDRLVVLARE
jgi:voltage-gated potassium channel Kch